MGGKGERGLSGRDVPLLLLLRGRSVRHQLRLLRQILLLKDQRSLVAHFLSISYFDPHLRLAAEEVLQRPRRLRHTALQQSQFLIDLVDQN